MCRRAGERRPGALQSGKTCLLKGWLDMQHGGHVKRSSRGRGRLERPRVAKDRGRASARRPIGSRLVLMFGSRMAWTSSPILSPRVSQEETGRSWPAESRTMIFGWAAEMAGRIISASWREMLDVHSDDVL